MNIIYNMIEYDFSYCYIRRHWSNLIKRSKTAWLADLAGRVEWLGIDSQSLIWWFIHGDLLDDIEWSMINIFQQMANVWDNVGIYIWLRTRCGRSPFARFSNIIYIYMIRGKQKQWKSARPKQVLNHIYIYGCIWVYHIIYNQLVVVTGTMEFWMTFQKQLGMDNHPNWRTPSFFRGVGLNHQPDYCLFIY